MKDYIPELIALAILLFIVSLVLIFDVYWPLSHMPGSLPDGEHIASPPKNGLSVTIDHENGVICYRERLGTNVVLECMPYAEPGAPITSP